MSALNERTERELRRFGWTLGAEFERRYVTDAWVFNLVNAISLITAERDEARSALAVLMGADDTTKEAKR